jgi:hypothetical protein
VTKKCVFIFLLFTSCFLLLAPSAQAICPVCTVAVAGGLGLSRWLGIDDVISGIWIGALILSSSLWLIDWIEKKFPHLKSRFNIQYSIFNIPGNILLPFVIILLSYAIILIPLALTDIVGHPLNTIFGIDKLIFGTFFGTLGFLFGVWLDKKARKVKAKQLVSYQKVIFPVGVLAIASLVFYFLLPFV